MKSDRADRLMTMLTKVMSYTPLQLGDRISSKRLFTGNLLCSCEGRYVSEYGGIHIEFIAVKLPHTRLL